jgi:hypothetical protein
MFPAPVVTANAATLYPPIIGNAGGMASGWVAADFSLTRPNNTTAYAANQALGNASVVLYKFTGFFRATGSSALLTGMRIKASVASIATSNMGAITAHLWNAAPATLPAADASAFNLLTADNGAQKLGTVAFSTWNIGGASSDMIDSYGTPILTPLPLIGAAAAADLYCILVATAAFTPIANAIITPYVSAVLD